MGKTHKPTKTPTRDEQRQFAANKFRFLELVALIQNCFTAIRAAGSRSC